MGARVKELLDLLATRVAARIPGLTTETHYNGHSGWVRTRLTLPYGYAMLMRFVDDSTTVDDFLDMEDELVKQLERFVNR